MCYAKPGPRCSNHALKTLSNARVAWDEAQTDVERSIAMTTLKEAREQYDTTPIGQRDLKDAIRWGRDPDGLLSARLEHGIAKRAQMLESIGTKDSGDIDDSTIIPLRAAVKPPKWGHFPNIPADAVIEVGARRKFYQDEPCPVGQEARRDVYLDGTLVGYVQQYAHTTTRPIYRGSRIVTPTGHPTTWVMNGKNYWNDFTQMNDAIYHLVDDHFIVQKQKQKEES